MESEHARRRRQRQTLKTLAISQSGESRELELILNDITAAAAACLDLERASVWSFTPTRDGIVCLSLYERADDRHTRNTKLLAEDFPSYFQALTTERTIVADDAHTHEATCEFSESYLTPLGIGAMLDAPIRVGGDSFGVVCLEHVGPARTWSPDEIDFAGSLADMTGLAVASDRIRRSDELLNLALDAGDIGTFVWYPATDRVLWDARTHQILDWPLERFQGTFSDFADRVHPDDRAHAEATVRESFATGSYRTQMRVLRQDGSERILEARGKPRIGLDGSPDHLTGVCYDVTERRDLERHVFESQKLESLGLLAGGIAHDFNNLLVGVLGNVSLLLAGTSSRTALESIQTAAERAADLCNQLLAYSGRATVSTVPVNLTDLIRSGAKLHQSSVGKGVTFRLDLAEDLPTVEADITQLRQIVMNLVINASDAIGDREGTITLQTAERELDAEALASWTADSGLTAGTYVYFSVTDDGPGISPEVQARMFDPFFSTKGQGRGLGLAAIRGIVRTHGGALRVSSQLGRGATFEIVFRASDLPAPDSTTRPAPPPEALGGTVLIVDDEALVLEFCSVALTQAGMQTEATQDALEAVEMLERSPDRYALAILDLTMPRLNGVEVARRLRALRPTLPILFSSGYSEEEVARDLAELASPVGFVHKPYRMAVLLQAVQQLLAAKG